MGGGLMQLVAYGAQDIYLTGQPQITFFKSVYRRHTNFAIESIQQTINGSVAPGSRVSVTISRNGDLLKNLWIQYNPRGLVTSGSTGLADDLSHAMLQILEIEIPVEEEKWTDYEFEETQVKIDLADVVLYELVAELININSN